MKKILLFGAGKSATVLIDYLIDEAEKENWMITVVDANLSLIEQKTGNRAFSAAVAIDISEDESRRKLIAEADLVISMMPPSLHILIARDCIEFGCSLLTASYLDEAIQSLDAAAKDKGIIMLCEMGLDPGIDHMSAMRIIDEIHAKGGNIRSFKSHCGGLVAPESDDNPWHYKISWNPRNVVMAGKAGALYKENGIVVELPYEKLFALQNTLEFDGSEKLELSYYPNRNSLPYIQTYHLEASSTFIRTTLRYPDFMSGWNNLIELKLTDETLAYQTDGLSISDFFAEHFKLHGLSEWLDKKISRSLVATQSELHEIESKLTNNPSSLQPDEINKASALIKASIESANKTVEQLVFLGLQDHHTIINKGFCSAADVLQFILENKLVLESHDKDMIVMLHELDYEMGGESHSVSSSLVVKGKDHLHTAMAQTVGLPLGIAAKLILKNELTIKGVCIPTIKEIYHPVLNALEHYGIQFIEKKK